MSIPEPVRRLLAKYPSIIRSETLTPTPTHGVEHVIDTGGNSPVFAKARRLAPRQAAHRRSRVQKNSKQQVSSAGPTPLGRPPSTWWPRRTAPGDPAATTGGSTPSQRQTGTPCRTCRTSPMASTDALSSARSTSSKDTIRYPSPPPTSPKPPSSLHLDCLSTFSWASAYETLHKHSKGQ
jgi:hypothetical protein